MLERKWRYTMEKLFSKICDETLLFRDVNMEYHAVLCDDGYEKRAIWLFYYGEAKDVDTWALVRVVEVDNTKSIHVIGVADSRDGVMELARRLHFGQ